MESRHQIPKLPAILNKPLHNHRTLFFCAIIHTLTHSLTHSHTHTHTHTHTQMDSRTYSRRVEEFLEKMRNGQPVSSKSSKSWTIPLDIPYMILHEHLLCHSQQLFSYYYWWLIISSHTWCYWVMEFCNFLIRLADSCPHLTHLWSKFFWSGTRKET